MAKSKTKKRKRVLVQLLKRVHAGEVTEPYRLMEEIRAIDHGHLADAKIGIAWRLGWRADTDGHLRLGTCQKRTDLDRELDGFDFMLLLNKEAWPQLNERQKRALIDHELCHAQVVIDSDGNPRKNDRDRLLCRIKKHDTEEFRAVVERHGLWTADLEQIARAGINDARRPLLPKDNAPAAAAAGGGASDDDAWKSEPLGVLNLDDNVETYLRAAGYTTLGELSAYMDRKSDFWAKDLDVGGERKPRGLKTKVERAYILFWSRRNQAAAASW
jgi:hypothetical protein